VQPAWITARLAAVLYGSNLCAGGSRLRADQVILPRQLSCRVARDPAWSAGRYGGCANLLPVGVDCGFLTAYSLIVDVGLRWFVWGR